MSSEKNQIKSQLPSDLQSGILNENGTFPNRSIQVKIDTFTPTATYIYQKLHSTMDLLHVTDERQDTGKFKIYCLLSNKELGCVTVIADIDPKTPKYESLTPHIYCANWYEREIKDMFGIIPEGHPDPRPLVLYDDWPTDTYPLRKDFKWNSRVPHVPTPFPYRKVDGEGIYEIPVGPVHAGVIEPGHFRFSVAGEPIVNLEIRLGYVHKGIEKLSENKSYDQGVILAERISGDNGIAHAVAYCQAVEKCGNITISERAKWLRTIYLELERLWNLFRDIAGITLVTAHNVGAMHLYHQQEKLHQLNAKISGHRYLWGVICPGGVKKDLNEDDLKLIKAAVENAQKYIKDHIDLISNLPSFLDRTQTTGIVTKKQAEDLDLVGPIGRASGLDKDVRRDKPYAAYNQLQFDVITQTTCDVEGRYLVKCGEIQQTIRILTQCLDQIQTKSGELKIPIKISSGQIGYSYVESSRGEIVHWIKSGDGVPFRHKIRDASFLNWLGIQEAAIGGTGNIVPDFPLINKSMNLSYSGSDL